MEQKLINEINRYRELVGLSQINEAVISGGGLIGKLLEIAGFVDNVADESINAAVRLEAEAAADATGEISSKLARVQDELVKVAESAGITNVNNYAVRDLIDLLKMSTDNSVKTNLIKVLNRYFDESNIITTNIIKNNKVLTSQIDKLDSKVLRDTLEETLGLQTKYLDDIINTFYSSVSDASEILKKLGITFDDASTQTIRKEILSGLESSIANPEIKKYIQFIGKDGSDKMKVIYKKSFDKINDMVGGITDANAETYFNGELSKLITQLKDAGMTKDALTKFNEAAKGILNTLTGYKNIEKTKGLRKAANIALAIPRAYVLSWGTLSLITGLIAFGETALTSDDNLMKQYLQTEEGAKLFEAGDMRKFNENFDQWKSKFYQGGMAALKKFAYPISQLGGLDLSEKSNYTKEQVEKAFKEIKGTSTTTTTTTTYIDSLEDKDGQKGFKSYVEVELKGDKNTAKYDSESGFYKFNNKDYSFKNGKFEEQKD